MRRIEYEEMQQKDNVNENATRYLYASIKHTITRYDDLLRVQCTEYCASELNNC